MISEERLLKILRAPHISEKATSATEKANAVIFKVAIDATKKEIKAAVEKLFEVNVKSVNTLITKGKTRRKGRCPNFKKAHIALREGEDIGFIGSAE
jgi:large subunit ribosomal protein L23